MTKLLATVFGIYMIAAGIGLALNRERAISIIDEFEAQPALAYFCGAMMTLAGAALVLTHNTWQGWPAIIVTLIGWGCLIEGVLFLTVPTQFMLTVKKFMPSPTIMLVFAIFAIGLGICLIVL